MSDVAWEMGGNSCQNILVSGPDRSEHRLLDTDVQFLVQFCRIFIWYIVSTLLVERNIIEHILDYTSSKHVEETLKNDTVICPKQAYYNRTLAGNATFANDDPSIFERIWDLHSTVPVFLGLGMFPLLNFKSPSFFAKFNSLGMTCNVRPLQEVYLSDQNCAFYGVSKIL